MTTQIREIEEPRGARLYTLPTPIDGRPATYEEYLVSIGLSANTIRNYVWRLDRAEKVLAAIGATVLGADSFQLAAMAAVFGNSHGSRGQLRCALKHFYQWRDRMDAPLRAVRVPPQPQMVNKALDPDQARALLDTARGWWPEGGSILFGLFLALRRTKIASATWERFDEDMAWYTVFGKNSKTATLPVHPTLRAELEPRRGTGYIFPGRKNGRDHVHPNTVWEWSRNVATAAGIPVFTTHQLRHTALTTALDNTGNLRSVMEFARHVKPDTTAGYTRTTKAQLQAVADALNY